MILLLFFLKEAYLPGSMWYLVPIFPLGSEEISDPRCFNHFFVLFPSGAAEICERHGAQRALGALLGEKPEAIEAALEVEDAADVHAEGATAGANDANSSNGQGDASAKEPCGGPWFGSAVDPSCMEEEAEQDALAQMHALEEEPDD